jgi:hypothetical protein
MAEVDPLPGEAVEENNRAAREVNIIDDYLRLMYVDHEPSWEWRFVKEVFHRDKLVGMDGFRTYLASSDPQVRETNILFLPTLTPKRSEFFANDVIFLGDMPRNALTDRFCEMTREFVGRFGGGLVVIAGARFGPAQLRGTALEDMLPVILDPESRLRDERSFRLRRTVPCRPLSVHATGQHRRGKHAGLEQSAIAALVPAGGPGPRPGVRAGRASRGHLPGRQDAAAADRHPPVRRGRSRLSGLRRDVAAAAVVRRTYYREFWSQLIYRLGMSHALGAEKRFVARTDRQEYRVEDRVTVTVEAYNENFDPLVQQDLPDGTLSGELTVSRSGGIRHGSRADVVDVAARRVRSLDPRRGRRRVYHVRVRDPIGGGFHEIPFTVTGVSAERRSGIRNRPLQEQLARETGGDRLTT